MPTEKNEMLGPAHIVNVETGEDLGELNGWVSLGPGDLSDVTEEDMDRLTEEMTFTIKLRPHDRTVWRKVFMVKRAEDWFPKKHRRLRRIARKTKKANRVLRAFYRAVAADDIQEARRLALKISRLKDMEVWHEPADGVRLPE